ncbi:MAG TPA: hypothetical protein DDW50_08620 [Firmicutes bacterium]|jgi:uncharacterized 2Fe-2S/4Fe-4S cluster protein (DUF4445 family)|nr:hypothetical protein [Bacillota bacterium]
MADYFEVTFIHQGYSKLYPEGMSLLEIIRAENIPYSILCNGEGTCGKCRVRLVNQLTVPTTAEQSHLSQADLAHGYRLACQTRLTAPLELELPEVFGQTGASAILHEGLLEINALDPFWGQITVDRPAVLSWKSVAFKLDGNLIPSIEALQELAQLQPKSLPDQPKLTLEYFQNRIIHVRQETAELAQSHPKLGVAVDIGTTTLAAYLVDLQQGCIRRTASAYNPQAQYGADVISRIQYASTPETLLQLHQVLITAINQLLFEMVKAEEIPLDDIIQLNLVGNSCMAHLVMKVNPTGLGQVPFEPVFKELLEFNPAKLGIKMNSQARAFLLPGIGGFVGSDISAGILACRLTPSRRELFIDIGTNCEMVLSGFGKMLGCSTAAGPAFEGATIACGMLARPGAITDIVLDPQAVKVMTIQDGAPEGICGTGLIRIMVALLHKGIIAESGGFAPELSHPFFDRVAQRFYLVRSDFHPIYLTQQDIRQFQLAKGAIRCGIELLLKHLALSAGELEIIYLAGAFGTYLNPADAIFLGLLPPVPLEKIRAVGNTAGTGAVLSLLSQSTLKDLASRVRDIEHVELADDPDFTEAFTSALVFDTNLQTD